MAIIPVKINYLLSVKMDDDVRDIFEVKLLTDSAPQPLTKDAILHPQKVMYTVALVLP